MMGLGDWETPRARIGILLGFRQQGDQRLERRVFVAWFADHLADLERDRDAIRGRGHGLEPGLQRRTASQRLDHVRVTRLRRSTEHTAEPELYGALIGTG